MEEVDKGCPMIRMGVSGWVFLRVSAYPGSPGPKPLNGCVCVCNMCDWCVVVLGLEPNKTVRWQAEDGGTGLACQVHGDCPHRSCHNTSFVCLLCCFLLVTYMYCCLIYKEYFLPCDLRFVKRQEARPDSWKSVRVYLRYLFSEQMKDLWAVDMQHCILRISWVLLIKQVELYFSNLWPRVTITTSRISVWVSSCWIFPRTLWTVYWMGISVCVGGLVAELLACWTLAQKGPGSNHSRNAVG